MTDYGWRKLDDNELDVLHSLPTGGTNELRAYATWIGPEGIEMGPVRFRAVTYDGDNVYVVSPFCGAWTRVHERDIIRVRHVDAML